MFIFLDNSGHYKHKCNRTHCATGNGDRYFFIFNRFLFRLGNGWCCCNCCRCGGSGFFCGCFLFYISDFFSISYKFFRKSGFIRAHHRTKGFWTNVCRLPHKRRKGLCLTPKQQFRLMMQGSFLLCLCQRGAFTGF